MKRIRVRLGYVIQVADDYDTEALCNIESLAAYGFHPSIKGTDNIIDLEPGATLALTFLAAAKRRDAGTKK